MKPNSLAVALSCLFLMSGTAQARLMEGSYLGFRVYDVNTGLTVPNLGNGLKFVDPNITYSPNPSTRGVYSDSNISLTFLTSFTLPSWVGYEYSDAFGTIDSFTQITLNSETNLIGLDQGDISFDADHIWISMGGVTVFPGSRLSVDVASGPVPSVPEPDTYALMLAGLGLLGLTAKRRKQQHASASIESKLEQGKTVDAH